MAPSEEKVKRIVPIISASAFAIIAIGASICLAPQFNPLTIWIAIPINALVLGAFGYWFGTCQNLDDAIRKLPGLVKRLIPRFSVRTLAIFVTLVCAYFGAWEATKRYTASLRDSVFSKDGSLVVSRGDDDASKRIEEIAKTKDFMITTWNFATPGPLIVSVNEVHFDSKLAREVKRSRCYYLWVFGPKIKLPFESKYLPRRIVR